MKQEADKMGLESYNFLLYPKKNKVRLTDDGWETYGEDLVLFTNITRVFEAIPNVNVYIPKDKWSTDDSECYYSYRDDTSIIEMQINSGVKSENVEEISVRFAVCNPEGTFEKTIQLCRQIAIQLELNVLDMKLHEVLDFDNEIQLWKSKKKFGEKRETFFLTFDFPVGIITKPLYCGEVIDVLRGKK